MASESKTAAKKRKAGRASRLVTKHVPMWPSEGAGTKRGPRYRRGVDPLDLSTPGDKVLTMPTPPPKNGMYPWMCDYCHMIFFLYGVLDPARGVRPSCCPFCSRKQDFK